ncbi:Outer membrane ligand-binding receptor [Desulfonema limicola]|uniref:Outer membrane ligand-binding receptor n=1 Tax=Desulfonema limicola TaxID=45656 RepID=A0A975B7K9_9BACT|nr:penicillin-binding protein activator [Desulfonema limicola]QTA80389.1 Outer membrane ligand-binding receptor [Desulfonema limicola]
MKLRYFQILAAIILLICLNSCVYQTPGITRDQSKPEKIKPEKRLFLEAEQLFQNQSYRQAMAVYKEYMLKFPDGESAPDALIREGYIYQSLKDYTTARSIYEHILNKYQTSNRIADAMVEILMTYYHQGAYKDLIMRADDFIKHKDSHARISTIYLILGNTYTADKSPANAFYFFAKSFETAEDLEKEIVLSRIKKSVQSLAIEEIQSLMERVTSESAREYLLFQLGSENIKNGLYEDGVRVLNQFIDMYPEHEYKQEAERLISEAEERIYMSGKKETHSIGCLLPLTGSYKLYGNQALKGIELALDKSEIKDLINIIIKDTGSDPELARIAVEELVNENVSAIIGPIITSESAALAAQKAGIPIITLTQKDGITETGDYVFRHFLTPRLQVKAITDYAVNKLGLYNFAVLFPDEKYGTTFMNLFWEELSALGGTIVASESYNTRQTDFKGPIRRILRQGFDAIFIPDSAKKAGLIIPQLTFYGARKVPLFGTNLWHSEDLIHRARKFVQGAVFPDVYFSKSNSYEIKSFIDNYFNSYREEPGFIEALGYDTALMLLNILGKYNVRSAVDVKNELLQLRNFQCITGLTGFDDSGEAHKKLFLLKVEGSRFVELPFD